MHRITPKSFGPVHAFEMGYSPIGQPMMSVHFYYLDGLLVDTGQSHMRPFALEAVAGRPVDAILLTHHHEDHSGNAAAFHRQTGAPVYGHPLTSAKLAKPYRILPYQRLVWGPSTPAQVKPITVPVETDRYRLMPIHTPGHSKDHLVYLEETQGWLFSGDLFIGERIKFFRSDEKIDQQIASLKHILQHDFDTLFCAHNPCSAGGRRSLSRKLEYLEGITQKVGDLLRRGWSAREIIRRLDPKTDRWVKWITMGNASFANMVRSAITAATAKGKT